MASSQLRMANQSNPALEIGRAERKTEATFEPMIVRRYLRTNSCNLLRFVNVSTGNQRFANLCLVKLVDAVVKDPKLLLLADSPRVALYQYMLSIIREFVAGGNNHGVPEDIGPERFAYLLSELEGFSLGEVAQILGSRPDRIQFALSQLASKEGLAPAVRILVIEDDPLISWQIERLIAQLGHQLLGIATTRKQATKYFTDLPDIILADVQLADGSTGVDTVAEMLCPSAAPVIFVTADPDSLYSEHFARTTFIVSKPFIPSALKAMINQAVYLSESQRSRPPVARAT